MNSKKAKQLRKILKQQQIDCKDATYKEKYRHSVWLRLPRVKDDDGNPIPWKIDWKQIKEHLAKIDNPKFRGQGLDKQLRYSPGIPIKLDEESGRAQYQKLKSEKVDFNVA